MIRQALPDVTFLPHAFDTLWHGYGPVTVQDGGEALAGNVSISPSGTMLPDTPRTDYDPAAATYLYEIVRE